MKFKNIIAGIVAAGLLALSAQAQTEPSYWEYYTYTAFTSNNVNAVTTNDNTGITINTRKFDNIWVSLKGQVESNGVAQAGIKVMLIPTGDGTTYSASGVSNKSGVLPTMVGNVHTIVLPSVETNVTCIVTNFACQVAGFRIAIVNNSTGHQSQVQMKWGGKVPRRQ